MNIFYNTTEFFAERVNYYDDYDRKGPKIFVGEVAVNEGNYMGQLYAALGEAAFLMGIEKNQDIVTLASYAPLFENVNYRAWYPNLIRFNIIRALEFLLIMSGKCSVKIAENMWCDPKMREDVFIVLEPEWHL